MKTFEFTSYQSTLIDAMRNNEEEIRDIRMMKHFIHEELVDSLPFHEGDLAEITCKDRITGEVFIEKGVISWVSINEKERDVTGLYYPLRKDGKPSKKLRHLSGSIIAVNVIQKGGQNGNA